MVYKRSYKKRAYKRRPAKAWYNKKYSVGDIASTAYKGVKTLQSIINSEKKFYPYVGTASLYATGSTTSLQALSQGDTQTSRNGNSIFVRSVSMKFNLVCNGSASATCTRMMLVQDDQQIADTAPAVTDILETAHPLSHLSLANLGRFKVLWDKTVLCDPVTKKQNLILYKNNTIQHHVRFNGTTGSDVQKGGLYLLLISDEATNAPTLEFNMRIGFYDN